MAIIPIPTTRVSDQMLSQRLLGQLQSDQVAMLRLQNAISTGQRITLPSEDAPAALRAISLQSLLERKAQTKTNIQTNQSYLNATDSALGSAAGILADAKGTALSVVGSTSSEEQRAAAASEIDRAIQQLVNVGNQNFRGRYLFAGSQSSVAPFQMVNGNVQYNGDEGSLQSYSDLNYLFDSNISGQQAFGALSSPIQGSVDLNPTVTAQTLLADLRGGQGIRLGTISLSDGTHNSTVDLSSAKTVGDVATLIEAHAPPGRFISVDLTAAGLNVSLDPGGGGSFTIKEVGGGKAATDLGILTELGNGTAIVGTELNPRLSATTSLQDILGVRATKTIGFTGNDNELKFEAVQRGAGFNNVTISFVDNGAITQGHETVQYDDSNPANKKLIFQIDAGSTTANDILAALNNDPVASQYFRASLTGNDTPNAVTAGRGLIDPSATGVTSGGAGLEPDLASGIQIVNGGRTYTVDLSTAKTMEDVLNLLNGSGAGVLAELNSSRTGINVRSRLSGGDFSIGENGGLTATQLGIRNFNADTRLTDLNHGLGVHEIQGDDFIIRRKDGVQLSIDVSGATTIQDVIDRINNAPNNSNPATRVVAQLSQSGNGIELTTADTSTTATLAVLKVNNSQAAEDLGLIPVGQTQSAAAVSSGGVEKIAGRDVNSAEVTGVFNALTRIRNALTNNNQVELERGLSQLDDTTLQVNFARSEVGARLQTLDSLQERQDQETIDLKSALSLDLDTDIAGTTVDLLGRQSSFQASLQVAAQISKLSLLNYL